MNSKEVKNLRYKTALRAPCALMAAMVLLFCGNAALAAVKGACTDASALETPGQWKAIREPGVDIEQSSIIPKAEWPALAKRMDVYAEILHQALGPQHGYEATWHRSVGGDIYKGGPAKNNVLGSLFRYYCDRGAALQLNDEYADLVSFEANGVWHMAGPEAGYVIGDKHAYRFGTPIGEIRGFPVFEADWHGTPPQITWVVLVARPGRSPFTYITRKELLDHLKTLNEKNRADGLNVADSVNPIRPQAVQDKDREKELALFLKGAKDGQQRQKWTDRFNHDYRTDEQKREEARKKFNTIHDKIRARLDIVAARYTPEQLGQAAMTGISYTNYSPDDRFDFIPTKQVVCGKSTSCGEHHGTPLAVPNKDYFDPTFPRSAPQFFAVSFAWQAHVVKRDGKYVVEEPKWEKIRDDFFTHIDFDRLISLLGK